MYDIHFELPTSTVEGIVNTLAQYFVIERLIQSQRENLVESQKYLAFNVDWVNAYGCVVKHIFNIRSIGLVKGIHSLQLHSIVHSQILDSFRDPAQKAVSEAKTFRVGERIRQDRSQIRNVLPYAQPVKLFLPSILVQLNLQVNYTLPPVTVTSEFVGMVIFCLPSLQSVSMTMLLSTQDIADRLQVVLLTLICEVILLRASSTSAVLPSPCGEKKYDSVSLGSMSASASCETRAMRSSAYMMFFMSVVQ